MVAALNYEPAMHNDSKRRKLPEDRRGIARDFTLNGHRIHVHTGEYEDGSLGEIFIQMDQEGSTMSGVLDGFATSISLAIQYGVPLSVLAEKFCDSKFEPSGYTEIGEATSIFDLIFQWLRSKYA